MEVVDDDNGAGFEPCKKGFKKSAREYRQRGEVFGSQCGKGRFFSRRGYLGRKPEIVEKGGGVGVSGIGAIPDSPDLPAIEPVGKKRRLARPGGGGYPSDSLPLPAIEKTEQPFTSVSPRRVGACYFGDLFQSLRHVWPSPSIPIVATVPQCSTAHRSMSIIE